MSAIHLVTTVFLKPGDLLVAPHDCYGGSYRLFDSLATRGCYRVRFVDQGDERALQAALEEKPKLVLVESPSNPLVTRGGYCENLSAGARGGRSERR
ncbi:O-succinylhomoserine (thiol)-lyase [Salmonella enterica subsp. enterica]|uniref:O-succinylhomoserine (Thiol)-lyase n=1 Tax=Salmonella enterica I TaxID=59201 RepID=A0A379X3T7_SALET|nr:O-succinylhomoserine (thiol)-lyase [Salmonella enterica subsp. enterica]